MPGIPQYTEATNLNDIVYSTEEDNNVKGMLINKMSGIEALPYQFLDTVDRRISGTEMGRKYSEKIISRIPLLFITPCKPLFMEDFNNDERRTVADFLLSGDGNPSELVIGSGRYYSVDFDYTTYYNYLNCMLSAVASFLGIYSETISINGRPPEKIGRINWKNELNDSFKTFFGASENVVFYLDGMTSITESYTNETTVSSLASQVNGFSEMTNEIKFLFGERGLAYNLLEGASEVTSSISSSLSGIIGNLGGGIVQSLADKGVNTILNGGKIVFPEIWNDSRADKSYTLSIKLRSPDHDSLSIFLNVLKPYCRILALTLPRMMTDNPNGYNSPFLVKAYSKGLFNIDMGIISSLNVTKGAECCWNDDGLPTQIDIDLDIKDLYSSLAMSGFEGSTGSVVTNTSYIDFLANMAGLNVGQSGITRSAELWNHLQLTRISQLPSRAFGRFEQSISKLIGNLYGRLN